MSASRQMNLSYRRATLNDAERLHELRRQSILQLAPKGMSVAQAETWAAGMSMARMKQKLHETEVWVAKLHDAIVGWVAIRGDYLDGLYTDPGFVERGIGTGLLGLAERLMRENGVRIIRLEASWNAEEFYLRHGYEPAGPRLPGEARPLVKHLELPQEFPTEPRRHSTDV